MTWTREHRQLSGWDGNPQSCVYMEKKKYQFRRKNSAVFWQKLKKKNNCTMMRGIWARRYAEKISSWDEVVCKTCQYRYKKVNLKIFNFFQFLGVTFEKSIMNSSLKCLKCVAVYPSPPPRYGPSTNPKSCFSMQIEKVKFFNLSIVFVKIQDFSFYNIQYICLLFRKAASGISAWIMEWRMHCHTF